MTIRKETPKTIEISISPSSEIGTTFVMKSNNCVAMERKKRVVSFNKLVFIRETLHINNYTTDERKRVWYQKSELALAKVDMKRTIRLMIEGALLTDSDSHTLRGLEFRSRAGAIKRQENRLNALAAVLDEQDSQFGMGIQNEEAISLVYQRVSWKCKKEAFLLAKLDYKDVYNVPLSKVTENFVTTVSKNGDE
jgi:hypothetical protein